MSLVDAIEAALLTRYASRDSLQAVIERGCPGPGGEGYWTSRAIAEFLATAVEKHRTEQAVTEPSLPAVSEAKTPTLSLDDEGGKKSSSKTKKGWGE